MKQVFSLLVQTEEDKVTIHIEVDKAKFKTLIEPFLLASVQRLNVDKDAVKEH